jgi:transcriptional regulator with XRE-family HTH domain
MSNTHSAEESDDPIRRPGRYLKGLLEAQGRGLKGTAFRAGISVSYLSEVLNGKKLPTEKVGDAILRALDHEPDEAWRQMLRTAQQAKRSAATPPPDTRNAQLPTTPPAPVENAPPRLRFSRRSLVTAAIVALIALAGPAVLWQVWPDDDRASSGDAPDIGSEGKCRWKVTWPTAGMYEEPNRDDPAVRSFKNGEILEPYCTTHHNAAEDETYVKVSREEAADGVGWVRIGAVKRA